MGREIWCKITDKDGSEVWNSADERQEWVCGRDNATTYIASLVDRDEEVEDGCCVDITRENAFESARESLMEYYDQDKREIDKAKRELNDLLTARRNARDYKEFCSFGQAIEDTEDWLASEDFSRAGSLVAMMDHARAALKDRFPDGNLYFVVSE